MDGALSHRVMETSPRGLAGVGRPSFPKARRDTAVPSQLAASWATATGGSNTAGRAAVRDFSAEDVQECFNQAPWPDERDWAASPSQH